VPNRRKAERRFEFDKRRQLVIGTRTGTLSVAARCFELVNLATLNARRDG